MWGMWFAGGMLVGLIVLGGCERSDQEDVRGIGGAPGSTRGIDPAASPEQPSSSTEEPADDGSAGVADGEMIRDGGRMIRPGEE